MEAFPSNLDYNSLLRSLQGLNGVRHVHSLNVWSLTLDTNALTVHLAVGKFSFTTSKPIQFRSNIAETIFVPFTDDMVDRDVLLLQAQKLITNQFNILYQTIQIEKYHSKCMHTCQHCRPLWN